MSTLTTTPRPTVVEVSNPDDPMGMPAYGGDPAHAHTVLEPGSYVAYGYNDDREGGKRPHEGKAVLIVTEVSSHAKWWGTDQGRLLLPHVHPVRGRRRDGVPRDVRLAAGRDPEDHESGPREDGRQRCDTAGVA